MCNLVGLSIMVAHGNDQRSTIFFKKCAHSWNFCLETWADDGFRWRRKNKKVRTRKMADRKPNNVSGDHPSLKESKQDEPPNSRLFIVCGKSVTEDDFREAFHKFGTIEEIWMVKDRTTGEPKGTTFYKLSLNMHFRNLYLIYLVLFLPLNHYCEHKIREL